jgi:Ca-activated chloride channel homolog
MRLSQIVILIALIGVNMAYADEYRSKINEGYDLYKDGEYDKAAEKFKDAGILKPDKALPSYDKGTALYKSNDFEGAANEFQGSLAKNDPDVRADASYNIGNAYYRAGKYDQAIKSYIDALKLQPKDKDYKHNLEMALMQMKQQQQQNKQNKDDKKNQQQQKQDQQKQDQNKDQKKQDQAQNQQDKNKQDQKKQDQQQSSQQQKEEMDKQKAQELLARFANDEKDIQKRLKQVNMRGKSANDW